MVWPIVVCRALVYRVHPIPATLQDFIFDFGSLSPEMEKCYIESMTNSALGTVGTAEERLLISKLIYAAQEFVRKEEGDQSATSLRDVKRCLLLANFFLKLKYLGTETNISNATVLGLSFAYYFRLPGSETRRALVNLFRETIDAHIKAQPPVDGPSPHKPWEKIAKETGFVQILESMKKKFCSHFVVDEGIAMNYALTENLFVVLVCVLNKIPVFLVGNPGSSKTLTLQVGVR